MSEAAFWIALLVMIAGVLGTLLPALPGTPLIFLAALGYALYEGFIKVSPFILALHHISWLRELRPYSQ